MLYPSKWFLRSLTVPSLLVLATAALSFSAENTQPDSNHFSTDTAALYQIASKVTPPSGADVIFLENEERVVWDTEGKATRTRYYLYKVLTQRGADQWASTAANWEPWHEERPTLRARVITPDNVVHPVDPNTITDAPGKVTENNIFSDSRLIRAPLPAVAPAQRAPATRRMAIAHRSAGVAGQD